MTQPKRICLNHILVGDELGQVKIVELFSNDHVSSSNDDEETTPGDHEADSSVNRALGVDCQNEGESNYSVQNAKAIRSLPRQHRIVRILDSCLQKEPAISRAITNIRPIEGIRESHVDRTDKENNLFLISNKVGQLFVCDTDAVRSRLARERNLKSCLGEVVAGDEHQDGSCPSPMLSPIYYNMNNEVAVCGGQPINQTNILVVYRNGDVQHVNIGQDVLRSSLGIKRKAIRTLGMGYNSDAKAVHWRLDGSTGICYLNADASASAHLDEKDPLTDIVLSSPTHKLSGQQHGRRSGKPKAAQHQYNQSPCIKSRKYNEQDRLVPTQVINMITSRTEDYKPRSRICKWSSITSLNLIYRKLALYDLVGNFDAILERQQKDLIEYSINSFKLNDNRLALGGYKYALRVYDVHAQRCLFNSRTGAHKNPLLCPNKGEPVMIGDLDWLGGNKTTKKSPNMLAACSGFDSVVQVYDLRSPKPVFNIDLTEQTDDKWQPYENQPRGCQFTRICASGAPYSTAVPSQQLALGSTNGQLHFIDLRFMSRSYRTLGKLSGFCGGAIKEIRFVSESFETSKMVSCATDRFLRLHRIQTSFTSVISQRLAAKVFLGTKPTCVQPVCDSINQSYLSSVSSHCGSESHLSSLAGSDGWSLL